MEESILKYFPGWVIATNVLAREKLTVTMVILYRNTKRNKLADQLWTERSLLVNSPTRLTSGDVHVFIIYGERSKCNLI